MLYERFFATLFVILTLWSNVNSKALYIRQLGIQPGESGSSYECHLLDLLVGIVPDPNDKPAVITAVSYTPQTFNSVFSHQMDAALKKNNELLGSIRSALREYFSSAFKKGNSFLSKQLETGFRDAHMSIQEIKEVDGNYKVLTRICVRQGMLK